jgi:hypothetical protein
VNVEAVVTRLFSNSLEAQKTSLQMVYGHGILTVILLLDQSSVVKLIAVDLSILRRERTVNVFDVHLCNDMIVPTLTDMMTSENKHNSAVNIYKKKKFMVLTAE